MSIQNENNNQIVITRGSRKLTIALRRGYVLEQVVGLLNQYAANIQGREIICYPESPCDGYYVLADIVSDENGKEDGPWTTA